MAARWLRDAIAERESKLAGKGRVLVRPSGTEALVRVMVEASDHDEAQRYAEELAALIKSTKNI